MPQSVYDIQSLLTFSNSTKVINANEGWLLMSIRVDKDSTGNATITSENTDTIGGTTPNGITLKAGESLTLGTGQRTINGVTIVAASGCTVYIVAAKNAPIIG